MGYIDPHKQSGSYLDPFGPSTRKGLVDRDSRYYRKQSREDFVEAKHERGIDAQIFDKFTKYRVPEGFQKIPGASRSGALDPQTRSRMLQQEAEGLIELQRNEYGELTGWRPINESTKED